MTHPMAEAMAILAEAEKLDITYVETPAPQDETPARAFMASNERWTITVVEFDIEYQGFPPGSKGYDGMVRKDATIVHMTREVAERIFKKAAAQPKAQVH